MDASETQSKTDFSQTMESEFKSLFTSISEKHEDKESSSFKSQTKSTSLSFSVQGGSHEIALLISDVYAPTFKEDLNNWLKSIPDYPKPYQFVMGPITDLFNLKADSLFKDDKTNWGCEGHKDKLVKEKDSERMYYTIKINGTDTKKYCDYLDRLALTKAIESKRRTLERAIEIYLEEGPISASEFSLPPGTSGCQSKNYAFQSSAKHPSWKEITEEDLVVKVIFNMEHELKKKSSQRKLMSDQEIFIRYRNGMWESSDDGHYFNYFDNCALGGSGDIKSHKVCIRDLVLTFDSEIGTLSLNKENFAAAQELFTPLSESWKGRVLARVEYSQEELFSMRERVGYLPCNVKWSNVLRFDLSGSNGKCLRFAASTKGTMYVVFAAVPANPNTWYYFEISPEGVGIFKVSEKC